MITTALTSSCHWKTLATFCLQKKILQNLTEKQIMQFKTTLNWPFHDICYLVIVVSTNSCKGFIVSLTQVKNIILDNSIDVVRDNQK